MTIRGVLFCARLARGHRVAIARDFTRKENRFLVHEKWMGPRNGGWAYVASVTSAIN